MSRVVNVRASDYGIGTFTEISTDTEYRRDCCDAVFVSYEQVEYLVEKHPYHTPVQFTGNIDAVAYFSASRQITGYVLARIISDRGRTSLLLSKLEGSRRATVCLVKLDGDVVYQTL